MSNANPFDFAKAFEAFDPKNMTEKFQDMFKLDFSNLNESTTKNFEYLMETNKSIVEGSRQLMERQAQMLEQSVKEATDAATKLADAKDAGEVASKQTEVLESAYATALKNMAEISEMAKKTQEEVFEKTNTRITETLADLKSQISKLS